MKKIQNKIPTNKISKLTHPIFLFLSRPKYLTGTQRCGIIKVGELLTIRKDKMEDKKQKKNNSNSNSNEVKFDFGLYSDQERTNKVLGDLEANPPIKPIPEGRLEKIADYILFGKDTASGKSMVDTKHINIKTKYRSYAKRKEESLDGLMENPLFGEHGIQPLGTKNYYRQPKETFNREEETSIPDIVPLWDLIDKVDYQLKVWKGEIEDEETLSKLDQVRVYNLKHLVIDLRRQQYAMRDVVKAPVGVRSVQTTVNHWGREWVDWGSKDSRFKVAPLGLWWRGNKVFEKPWDLNIEVDLEVEEWVEPTQRGKLVLDFRRNEHVCAVLEHYEDIRGDMEEHPDAPIGMVLDTLDFYIRKAELDGSRLVVIKMKKEKWDNKSISEKLNQLYGKNHNPNYISTIWKKEICRKIAEAASKHANEWANRWDDSMWKICSCCKEKKLKDDRNFSYKRRSKDGFNGVCKSCDKKKRQQNKISARAGGNDSIGD